MGGTMALRPAAIILVLGLAAGCRDRMPAPAAVRPRIVSFAPALTEMLFDLGLGEHVVGVTSQCILPAGTDRPRVGDAIKVSTEPILAVEPDVVVVQVDPKKFQTVQRLRPDVRIEHFTIESIDDIAAAIERLGRIAGKEAPALRARREFVSQLEGVRKRVAGKVRPRVLFVMGYRQPSTGGRGTFIQEMIELAGGQNAAEGLTGWQELNLEFIVGAHPEVIVCQVDPASEDPARAKDYWLAVKGTPAAQTGRVHVVTDRHWTIPTARLSGYVVKLAEMVHPSPAGGSQP